MIKYVNVVYGYVSGASDDDVDEPTSFPKMDSSEKNNTGAGAETAFCFWLICVSASAIEVIFRKAK